MKIDRDAPVGVFDSGVGGLTVAREIMRNLPSEKIVYFGDTARVPYGSKSKETVIRYSRQIIRFLQEQQVKAIVVACNTASAFALDTVRDEFDIPIIGVIESGAKVAAARTRNKRVGIIGTVGTVGSGIHAQYLKKLDPGITVFGKACPLFVPLVENGFIQPDNEITIKVAQTYLQPMIENEVDTLILGCTHYPLIRPVIDRLLRSRVTLIDSGAQVARWAQTLLTREDMLGAGNGGAEYYVSDSPEMFIETAGIFLGEDVHGNVTQIDLDTL